MSRAGVVVCWALVGLLAWPWGGAAEPAPTRGARAEARAGPTAGPIARWLGPIGGLAASWEWVRWTTALRRGELARAHTHAARALALDPASPQGWLALAQHLVFDRSAAAVEPDRVRRAAFARAGLDVLRRGEERARDGATLALIGGDIAVFLAERAAPPPTPEVVGQEEARSEVDGEHAAVGVGDLDWPGGPDALLVEAAASYARALDRGHPDAAERLARLRAFR